MPPFEFVTPTFVETNNVIKEEKIFETLKNSSFVDNLDLVPWISIFYNNNLHDLENHFKSKNNNSTIFRWGWQNRAINKTIIDVLKYKTVFCCSPRKDFSVRQIPFPYFVRDSISYSDKKDILFSFVGWNGNLLRNKIFQLHGKSSSVIERKEFFSESQEQEKNKKEYEEILSKSRFSLCPRGVGSGSVRFWESLKAGAIPILISDEYPLPNLWDWSKTIIRISEYQLMNIPIKIEAEINTNRFREEEMRENCKKAYEFFSNPITLTNYINYNL